MKTLEAHTEAYDSVQDCIVRGELRTPPPRPDPAKPLNIDIVQPSYYNPRSFESPTSPPQPPSLYQELATPHKVVYLKPEHSARLMTPQGNRKRLWVGFGLFCLLVAISGLVMGTLAYMRDHSPDSLASSASVTSMTMVSTRTVKSPAMSQTPKSTQTGHDEDTITTSDKQMSTSTGATSSSKKSTSTSMMTSTDTKTSSSPEERSVAKATHGKRGICITASGTSLSEIVTEPEGFMTANGRVADETTLQLTYTLTSTTTRTITQTIYLTGVPSSLVLFVAASPSEFVHGSSEGSITLSDITTTEFLPASTPDPYRIADEESTITPDAISTGTIDIDPTYIEDPTSTLEAIPTSGATQLLPPYFILFPWSFYPSTCRKQSYLEFQHRSRNLFY